MFLLSKKHVLLSIFMEEIQISYNIFGFKSKILIIFLDFNRNFFIFAPKMS